MPGEVGVAVWGLGGHAVHKIVPALVACEATALVGVSSRRAEVAAEVAARVGCRTWSDPEAMLADTEVDVVYIATATGSHAAQAARALARGKHVWCEKSLTDDPARSLALVAQARRQDLALCEAFMFLHHPQFRRVHALADELGGVVSVTSRFGIPHQDRSGFRYARAQGGGALLDVGCYPLRAALALLGDVEVVAAGRSGGAGFEVDVDGWAVLAAARGARALLEWGYGVGYRNELSVWGRTGSLDAARIFSKPARLAASIDIADATGTRRREELTPADPFVAMFEAFEATVRDGDARLREWTAAEAQARLVAAVMARA
jgi:predicted dehydrogenase